MTVWTQRYASRAARIIPSEIRELLRLVGRPGLISFAGGIPDPDLFPREETARAYAEILGNQARARTALQYGESEGYAPLRDWIAARTAAEGMDCRPDQILVTNGSQQALDLVAKLFVSPGATVLVQNPTYLGALQATGPYEPAYAAFPQANAGAPPAALGYVMADFLNPTGERLGLDQRNALLDATAGTPLLEDTAYTGLRYEGPPLPSLLALEAGRTGGIERGRVLQCGTFSKTVLPGLRLGWVVGPAEVIRRLTLLKQAADLHSSILSQMVMLELVQTALPAAHERLRGIYQRRRDAMLQALAAEMPEGVLWTKPEGGLFVWVTLPEAIDGGALLQRAIAEGVAFVPGRSFHPDGRGANTIRLAFSLVDEERIATGIARLAGLLQEVMSETG